MKTIFISFVLLLAVLADASNVKRYFQDAKFPTQKMIEKQTITAPVGASTTYVVSGTAGNTSTAAATLSTFTLQPDVARNLVITPGGSTLAVAACTITVSGTNIFNSAITEDFAFVNDASSATTGAKAFKTITSVSFPANCEDSPFGATWSIGVGEKLGLKDCLDATGDLIQSSTAGTTDGTKATMVVDVDEVEKNTADVTGTMNGSNDITIYYMQNNRCNP